MSNFDNELAALSGSSMVAKNRAFFETLSVSQLSARNSRGPGLIKKRAATTTQKSSIGNSNQTPSRKGSAPPAKKDEKSTPATPTTTATSTPKSSTSLDTPKSEKSSGRKLSFSLKRKNKKDKKDKSGAESPSTPSTPVSVGPPASSLPAPQITVSEQTPTPEKPKPGKSVEVSTPEPKKTSKRSNRDVQSTRLISQQSSPASIGTTSVYGARPTPPSSASKPKLGNNSPAQRKGGFSAAPKATREESPKRQVNTETATNSNNESVNTGVIVDEEAGIIRLPPSLTGSQYAMDPAKEKKRQHVIRELMHTEAEYAQQLKAIVQHYLVPMRENGVVTILEHSHIFSNLEILTLTAVDIAKALESRKRMSGINGISGIGDIFLSRVDDLIPVYSNYCSHQAECLSTLERLRMKEKKAFLQFTQEAKAAPSDVQGLELDALVIKPVQRICKYPLLFKELMRETPEDHPDHRNLERAQECLEKLVQVVNENSREANNLKRILNVENSLTNAAHIKLLMPGRHFVCEGKLTKISGKNVQDRQFFLFSDMLLYAKPILGKSKYEFKGLLPLDALYYKDLDDSETLENAFEVGRSDWDKKYILYSKEKKTKYHWLQQLAETKERLHKDKSAHQDEIGFRMQTEVKEIDTVHQLKLVDIQHKLDGYKDVIKPDRKFIREGAVKGILGEDRYLYLFNDNLMVTKQKNLRSFTYKSMIPMDSVAVADLPDSDVYQNAIELVRMDNQKKFTFECPSLENKQEWLVDLDAVTASVHQRSSSTPETATLERRPTYSTLPTPDMAAINATEEVETLSISAEEADAQRDQSPMLYRQQSAPVMNVKDSMKKTEKKKRLKDLQSPIQIVEDEDSGDEDVEAKKKNRKWDHDSTSHRCSECDVKFTTTNRRHHCRNCGHIFCGECTSKKRFLKKYGFKKKVRVCDRCFINPDRV